MKKAFNVRMTRTPHYAKALRAIGQNLEELGLKVFGIKSEGNDYVISEPIGLRYTPADIDRLDREGQAKRSDPSGMPDFRSLSQLLRAVGDYLEHKDARLLGVSRQAGVVPLVAIEYKTEQRQLKEEEYLSSDLYDFCLRMYKQRSTTTSFVPR
jgi:hypothetical protein